MDAQGIPSAVGVPGGQIPSHADLEFAEYLPTGTVHIHQYVPARYEEAPGEHDVTIGFAEGLALLSTTRQRMICGAQFRVGFGARGEWTDCFSDDVICGGCVRALGEDSARAFEHPQPQFRRG